MPLKKIALVLLAVLVLLAACSHGRAKDIAGRLADALTDALDLDGGTKNNGAPPRAGSDPQAPGIKATEGGELRLGAPFVFALYSDYAGSDVDRAIVYVEHATSHFVVLGTLVNGRFDVAGVLGMDETLRGQDFAFKFALGTSKGVIGPYGSYHRRVFDREASTNGKSITTIIAEGETAHEGGRPSGSTDASAPQITSLAGPGQLAAGSALAITLTTHFGATARKAATAAIDGVILTTPANTAYKEIPASANSGVVTVRASLANDLKVGDWFVFMLALRAGNVVGGYRPYLVRIVAATDGDAELEMEAEAENEPDAEPETESDAETPEAEPEVSEDGDDEPEGEAEAALTPVCDFRLVEGNVPLGPNGTIAFGDVVVNSRKTLTLRVDNTTGTSDCQLSAFRKDLNTPDAYSFEPAVIPAVPAGLYFDIKIACTPTTTGPLPGSLIGSSNDPRPEKASFSMRMTCTGVNPVLVISPNDNPTDLGSVLAKGCITPAKPFTIKNNGHSVLKVCRPTLIDDGWRDWAGNCYLKMGEWNSWAYDGVSGTKVEGDDTCWYLRNSVQNATDLIEFVVQFCGCGESFPAKNATPREINGIFSLTTNDPAYPATSPNVRLYLSGQVQPCPTDFYDLNGNSADGCEYKCDTENIGYEICDGKDNDCDGLTDETFDVPLSCKNIDGSYKPNCLEVEPVRCHGTGECGLGHKTCVPGAGNEFRTACDTDPGMPSFDSAAHGKELCDGLDNDCDGITDNFDFPVIGEPGVTCNPGSKGGQGDLCSGLGECKVGHCKCNSLSADPSQLFARCDAQDQAAARDICDGKDNDCDGITDNAAYFLRDSPATTIGCAECAGNASCHCTTSGVGTSCAGTCGTGAYVCDSPKTDTVVCSANIASASSPEICDGMDNNCNSQTDEIEYTWDDGSVINVPSGLRAQCLDSLKSCGYVGVACKGKGECGQGFTQCSPNDKMRTICSTDIGGADYTNSTTGGKFEICDGKDNDCDGTIDNGFDVGVSCLGTGECGKHPGTWVCNPNDATQTTVICSTTPGSGSPDDHWKTDESCDGKDNDCDGLTDEDFGIGHPCLGRGICGAGKIKCSQSGTSTCCSANPECGGTNMDVEKCNGLDDDCDGVTDNGFRIGESCTAPGECSTHPGVMVCSSDQRASVCSSIRSYATFELCNNKDDDCDGVTDNGFDLGKTCLGRGGAAGTRQCAGNTMGSCCSADPECNGT